MSNLRAFVAVAVVVAAGCGKGAPPRLDCAWLAGNNCWKTATAAAAACLPPSGEVGVLNERNTSCRYPSGSTITFHVPLNLSTPPLPLDFAVAGADGQPCLTFESAAVNELTLDVHGQTVSSTRSEESISLTCPDGTTYTGRLSELDACPDASPSPLPGFLPSFIAPFSLFLEGTADSTIRVFSCNLGPPPKYNDCTITGGTGSFPPSLCVDFTGSGNTGNAGDPEARTECESLLTTCGAACQGVYYSLFACVTNNSVQTVVGYCVLGAGQPLEQTVTFYAPTTATQAETYCSGMGGDYMPV